MLPKELIQEFQDELQDTKKSFRDVLFTTASRFVNKNSGYMANVTFGKRVGTVMGELSREMHKRKKSKTDPNQGELF